MSIPLEELGPAPPALVATTSDMERDSLKHTSTTVSTDKNVSQESGAPSNETRVRDQKKSKKGVDFWMIILTLCMCMFLSALDLTAVSTVLPTIAEELHSENFSGVGSAYALSSTAFLPVFGGLAQTFGRKINMLASVVLFAVGSALCGSAHGMSQMIAGRTVQGIGGGGILAMTQIVVSDLVPLVERGLYMGVLSAVWALASAIGPISGGALANSNWRWLFYLNLPIAGLSFALVLFFMRLKVPEGSLQAKLKRVDWLGSGLFIVSATLIILGLTLGGDTFPWKSAGTLVPLLLGVVFLPVFVYVEMTAVEYPILPFELLNRTTAIGFLDAFLHGSLVMAIVYFMPSWFMGVKGQNPVQSGISLFPISFIVAPFAMVCGIVVARTQKYKAINVIGWCFCTIGAGVLLILKESSSVGLAIALETPVSIGLGLLFTGTTFPVLAPLPPSRAAPAMAFLAFSRAFGQVIGITVGTTILTNELAKKLPSQFLKTLHGGAAAAYSQIRTFQNLREPLRTQVRTAYSDSVHPIWYAMLALAAVGLLSSLCMKSLALKATTDESWGIKENRAPAEDQVKA